MPTWEFTLIVLGVSLGAGLLGSLTGLGGGGILTPVLILLMGVDIRYAVGASLVAVIATSSGSAAAYVRDGYTNVRVALLLEMATVFGAIGGAVLAAHVPGGAIAAVLGVVLVWTAISSLRPPAAHAGDTLPDPLSRRLGLDSTYPTPEGVKPYSVHGVPWGFALMVGAGVLSALVGIGSGVVKVLAMDRVMRLPFKVSTTTSNFMIGVTAAASAGVYLHRGQIEPGLAMPVAIGALAGSFIGAKVLPKAKTRVLRVMFTIIVAILGLQMILKGVREVTRGPGGDATRETGGVGGAPGANEFARGRDGP